MCTERGHREINIATLIKTDARKVPPTLPLSLPFSHSPSLTPPLSFFISVSLSLPVSASLPHSLFLVLDPFLSFLLSLTLSHSLFFYLSFSRLLSLSLPFLALSLSLSLTCLFSLSSPSLCGVVITHSDRPCCQRRQQHYKETEVCLQRFDSTVHRRYLQRAQPREKLLYNPPPPHPIPGDK